jgi:hypothetical protein
MATQTLSGRIDSARWFDARGKIANTARSYLIYEREGAHVGQIFLLSWRRIEEGVSVAQRLLHIKWCRFVRTLGLL